MDFNNLAMLYLIPDNTASPTTTGIRKFRLQQRKGPDIRFLYLPAEVQ